MTTYENGQRVYGATIEEIEELDEHDIKELEKLGINDSNINGLNTLPYLTANDKKDLIDFIKTIHNNEKVRMDVNDTVEDLVVDVKSKIKEPVTFVDRNKLSRNVFNTIVDNYTTSMNKLELQQMEEARVKKHQNDSVNHRKSDTPAIHHRSLFHMLKGNPSAHKRSRKSRHLRGGSKKVRRRASNKSKQRRRKTKRQ